MERSVEAAPGRLIRYTGRATRWLSIVGLVLCAALAISGLFLRYFYSPEAAKAYSDIQDLHTSVAFGLVARNVHRWSAVGLLAALGGVVLFVLPLAIRPASVRWVRLSLGGAVSFVALPWLAVLAFNDRVSRWTGLDGSKLSLGLIRWYGVHPLGIVGPVVAFVGGLRAASGVTFRANRAKN